MIRVYPFEKLGGANHGWLRAKHHFSFASYQDPRRIRFGALRVINDDIIEAHTGFDPHPHRDMEIITYVRSGAISHEDSEGNKGRTAAGDVQVMSAGSGVRHSEYNRESEATNLYQIWIEPKELGVPPRWESKKFPKVPVTEALIPLASGIAQDLERGAAYIHQDATIYGGKLKSGTKITHPVRNQVYLLASSGEIEVEGKALKRGDGAEITDLKEFTITAISDAEVVVIDVPEASQK